MDAKGVAKLARLSCVSILLCRHNEDLRHRHLEVQLECYQRGNPRVL